MSKKLVNLEEPIKTFLVNPRFKFKTNRVLTKESSQRLDTEDLKTLDFKQKYGNSKSEVFLVCPPSYIVTGEHSILLDVWDFEPSTVFVIEKSNYKNYSTGSGLFNDQAFFVVHGTTKNFMNRKKKTDLTFNRIQVFDNCMSGTSYRKEMFDFIEKISYGPYCQIFGRKSYRKEIPDDWYFLEPDLVKENKIINEDVF